MKINGVNVIQTGVNNNGSLWFVFSKKERDKINKTLENHNTIYAGIMYDNNPRFSFSHKLPSECKIDQEKEEKIYG